MTHLYAFSGTEFLKDRSTNILIMLTREHNELTCLTFKNVSSANFLKLCFVFYIPNTISVKLKKESTHLKEIIYLNIHK